MALRISMNSSLDTVKERATLGLVGIAQGASAGLQPFFRGKTVILCRVRKCKEGLGVRRNPQTQSHFEVSYVLFALGGTAGGGRGCGRGKDACQVASEPR